MAFSIVIAAWLAPCRTMAGVADPMAVALEIKTAIMNSDATLFTKHLQDFTYFIDVVYPKKEMLQLFKKKDSWLQRNLFVGEDSLKSYFATAKDLQIVRTEFGAQDVISYQSSNYPPYLWPWCTIRPKGNSWVFIDMFSHR